MRARGRGDRRNLSSPAMIRDHRSDWRPDPHPPNRRDTDEDHRTRSIRNLSPLEMERSRRVPGRDRRSSSVEKRDYNRHLDGGKDCRVVRPRSPLYGQSRDISQFDEDIPSDCFRRNYIFPDPVYSNADATTLKYVGDSSGPSGRIGKQKDFPTTGSSALQENGMLVPKSLYMDGTCRTFYTLPPDVAGVINSGKVGGDIGYRKDEDLRYVDHPRPDKIAPRESYEEEKRVFYLRDAPYDTMPLPHSKAFGSTSSGPSKDDFLGFYGGGRPLSSDGFIGSGGKLTDPFNHDDYRPAPPFGSGKQMELRQSPPFGSGKHIDLRQKELASYRPGPLGSSWHETREYDYPELGRRKRVDSEYLSDNLYRKLHPNDIMDYDHSNSSRPSLMDPVVGRVEAAVGSLGTLTDNILWDHTSLQGEPASNYHDVNRTSWATKQDGELLSSRSTHLEFRPRMSGDHDNDMSPSGVDYAYGRDAGTVPYREKLPSSTISECDPDMYGLDESPERRLNVEDMSFYDPSVRLTNRNNTIDEEMNIYNHRYMSSSNDNAISQIRESIDSDEQWTGEHSTGLLWTKQSHSRHPQHGKKTGRVFDRMAYHRVSASDDWMPSEDLSLHVQGHPIKRRIAGSPKVSVKKRLRLGPPNFHNSDPLDRKHTVFRPLRFRNRNQDFHGDFNDQNAGPSEDQGSPVKPEPPEGSEKFNQKAYDAFLRFSKQLNENPAQRRRYKEQGNAGSLLCIVCGSQSKEFGDTRSLATHAVMSQKQPRADHRGLHRAICVLMGWNSIVPQDGAWVHAHAELPHAEALALKEDLILWPPVVIIRNSSILNKDPDKRKVVTIQDMEAILKEMGIGVGKAKVCHGRPANQSVMVVKFGPTFSGLQDAEKLHNYYTESKRGRMEFQQISAKSSNPTVDAEFVGGEHEMQQVLYGYLGIAEDLDKVDFGTKSRALVKSKKDIKAIADAPLRTE